VSSAGLSHVIEGEPESSIAGVYRALAEHVLSCSDASVPEPLDDESLREITGM